MEVISLFKAFKLIFKRKVLSGVVFAVGLLITIFAAVAILSSTMVDATISIVDTPLRDSLAIKSFPSIIFEPGKIDINTLTDDTISFYIQAQRIQQKEILKGQNNFLASMTFPVSKTLLTSSEFSSILVSKGLISSPSEFSLIQSSDLYIISINGESNVDSILKEAESFIEAKTKDVIKKYADSVAVFIDEETKSADSLYTKIEAFTARKDTAPLKEKFDLLTDLDNYARNLAVMDNYKESSAKINQLLTLDLKPTVSLTSRPSSKNTLLAAAVVVLGLCLSVIAVLTFAILGEHAFKKKEED